MRITFSIFLYLALALCGSAKDGAPWKSEITIERIDHPKQVEGYWALSGSLIGYMGLALELRDGQFRYWFANWGDFDSRDYPVTGKYTVKDGFLVLDTKQDVYDTRWLLITSEGYTGLFPFSAFERIIRSRESPHPRMLFHLPDDAAWPQYNAPK